jgi:hypothetical protein
MIEACRGPSEVFFKRMWPHGLVAVLLTNLLKLSAYGTHAQRDRTVN